MNGNQQINLNSIFNYTVIFMVIYMAVRIMNRALEAPKERPKMLGYGKPPPGYKPVHHSSVAVMPKLPEEARGDYLFVQYIRGLVKLGETVRHGKSAKDTTRCGCRQNRG